MNSEKTVIDLENDVKAKIAQEHQDSVSYKLRNLLDCKTNKEKQIANIQAELDKTIAKLAELEALSVEDAYILIQKDNCPTASPIYSVNNGCVWMSTGY